MSLKILYGVVGEGMGHATRSSVIIEHLLSQGHQVKAVASQRAFNFLQSRFQDVDRIHGLHIKYDDEGVKRRQTFLSNVLQLPENLSTNVGQYFEMMGSFEPDVVISDFDSFAYLYATNHRKPILSIDNMQILNRCRHENLPTGHMNDFRIAKALVKSKLPGCNHYLITSFFFPPVRKRRTSLYPPILRKGILDATSEDRGHILVYQTSASCNALLPTLQAMKQYEFRVYGMNREEDLGNVKLSRFSEAGFIHDLSTCRAVVANGGFSLMGECIYLHKPLLSVPVPGQFEQVLNAHYLHQLGYGEYWDALDADLLAHFLKNVPTYARNLASYRQDGNSKIFAALDEFLPLLAAGQPLPELNADFDGDD